MKKEVKGVSHPIELFNKSFAAVRNNLAIFTLLYVLPLAFGINGHRPQSNQGENFRWHTWDSNGIHISASAVGAIVGGITLIVLIGLLIAVFYQALLYTAQLLAARGTVSFRDLWDIATRYWGRLFLLIISMGIIIGVGLILFIVPGLIFLRRYYLAPYFMIDQNLGVMESLRRSAAMSKPISSYIWGVIGLMVLLSVPSFFSDIGSLVSLVLLAGYSVAPAILYFEAKKVVKV